MCLEKHLLNSSIDVFSAEKCYQVDAIIRHEGFVYEQHRTIITNDMMHLVEPVAMTEPDLPVPALGCDACWDTLLCDWLGRQRRWKLIMHF